MKEILGISINFVENVLLGFAAFFLVIYAISLVIEKKPHWFISKNVMNILKV